jgi:PAS domain S-box-containing protein
MRLDPNRRDSAIARSSSTRPRALVVEDDPVSSRLATAALRKWGYEVRSAADAAGAWRLLDESAAPTIAIVDWMLPDEEGVSLCRRVRASRSDGATYLLLLTARRDRDDLLAGFAAGADDYLTKPVDWQELRARVMVGERILGLQASLAARAAEAEGALARVTTLQQSTECLMASISSTLILVGIDAEGSVSSWNAEAERTFGLSQHTVLGRPLGECGIDWVSPTTVAEMLACRRGRRAQWFHDVRLRDSRRRERLLDLTVTPTPLAGAHPRGLLIVGADITGRKLLEAQLHQAQKLEAIGQLAAGIAHEINTPTQFVGDNIRFLQEAWTGLVPYLDCLDELATNVCRTEAETARAAAIVAAAAERADLAYLRDEIPRAVEQSLDGVRRVSRIVTAMREFSHPGVEEKTLVDLNRALETTVTVARSEWKYVAEVVTEFDPDLPRVSCHPGELNQVFLNLLVNAAQAIAAVSQGGSTGKGRIEIHTRRAGSRVEIRISDTGGGIPGAIRSRIFEPFFTTKEVGKGTGQGLALAHVVVVQKHQGQIWFETEEGRGTTFVIQLPGLELVAHEE